MKAPSLAIKSRVWIVSSKGTYLGEGRIRLLQAIDEHGSISKAARSMNMSYLKAWKLVDSMNSVTNNPLVTKTSGGKGGGGTILTENGIEAIKLYNSLNKGCQEFLNNEMKRLSSAK